MKSAPNAKYARIKNTAILKLSSLKPNTPLSGANMAAIIGAKRHSRHVCVPASEASDLICLL